jgi:hypothetical protein
MRLPYKDSATWRALITSLQSFLGFLVALAALPEFRQLLTDFYPQALPIVVTSAGVLSFILNYFRRSIKNY